LVEVAEMVFHSQSTMGLADAGTVTEHQFLNKRRVF